MQNIEFSRLRQFASHFPPILLVIIVLVLIRYPFFLNIDYHFSADEGMLASTILNLLNGGPIIFYYDFGRTFGLTSGLASAPFMWILGPTALAFHLPGVLYYSLYIWTTYLIAKTLIPRTAYLVLILMFFTPYFVTEMTVHNWPHTLVAFLGNLIFLFFLKLKSTERNNSPIIFLLFFTMGLAVYTYTYSFIFILTIGILYVLTHPRWAEIRAKISFVALVGFFKNKKTKMETFCRFLDCLIFVFFIAVVFSYIFGGFGLDIAGYSILQINEFHKAATQLLVLIFLRILINPKDSMSFLRNVKSYFAAGIESDKKQLVVMGVVGLLIGLSPRIASILIGETSRGGQGHDLDFSPLKLFAHLQDLFIPKGVQLFGFDKPFQDLISNPVDIYWIILGILFVSLIAIFFFSTFFFISENWASLKNIVTLRGMQFKAVHVILLVSILVCIANITTQNGPMARYMFPLFGMLTLWVGIYVDKVKEKVKWFPIIVLAIWVSFYSMTNYQAFQDAGLIEGVKPIKFSKHFIHDLVDFLEAEKISVAYSSYGITGIGTYFSGGKINISEYSPHPLVKMARQRARSMGSSRFAIIAQDNQATIYQNYLQEKRIEFKTAAVAEHEIFWGFTGNDAEINNLRSLISAN